MLKNMAFFQQSDNTARSLAYIFVSFLLGLLCSINSTNALNSPDYADALSKSILFFEGQRSGKLPPHQRLSWRQDSALRDGMRANVDLEGGYYDAGDNVKFNFPMAFTTTLLSWSVIEYGDLMQTAGELENANAAIRWGTDYILKTTTTPNVIFAQVGDPNSDHACWERPEDMDTPRNVYQINSTHPGSDLAAEIAAAMAAASIVFKTSDAIYSKVLINRAIQAFRFAVTYQGAYSNVFSSAVCPFYCSYSGYQDELLWGAAWLYRATGDNTYLQYILSNGDALGGTRESCNAFSWDNKYAGAQVLLSQVYLARQNSELQAYKDRADDFVCHNVPYAPYSQTTVTAGGLLFHDSDTNLQYVTTAVFLLLTYGQSLREASQTVSCGQSVLTPHQLQAFARRQVDYILGMNPLAMSYMVGYGSKFPQHIHHRGASIPCIELRPQHVSCKDGLAYFYSDEPNPNLLMGAIVGGPDRNDKFADERSDYGQSEPATYINAPLVGALAYLTSYRNQQL